MGDSCETRLVGAPIDVSDNFWPPRSFYFANEEFNHAQALFITLLTYVCIGLVGLLRMIFA